MDALWIVGLFFAFFVGVVTGMQMTLREMRSGYYTIGGKVFRVTMRDATERQDVP